MTKEWERQEGESETAYSALKMYLEMGADRSLKAVQEARDVSKSSVGEMARRHRWNERALAYDRYIGQRSLEAQLTVREAGLTEYSEAITRSLQAKLILVDSIASDELRKIRDAQQRGEDVDFMDLKRLLGIVRDADDLARRSVGLATAYRSMTSERDDTEQQVFYVGGNADDSMRD